MSVAENAMESGLFIAASNGRVVCGQETVSGITSDQRTVETYDSVAFINYVSKLNVNCMSLLGFKL